MEQTRTQENITVSDWLQYLQNYCSVNSSSQIGYVTMVLTILVAIFAIVVESNNIFISVIMVIVAIGFFFSTRKNLGDKYFFKGMVAGTLSWAILSNKYPKLKNVDSIEECWVELDHRIDDLSWNERRKKSLDKNTDDFKKWLEETVVKYK